MNDKRSLALHVSYQLYMFLDHRSNLHNDVKKAENDLKDFLKVLNAPHPFHISDAIVSMQKRLNYSRQFQTAFLRYNGMSVRKVKQRMKKSSESVKEFETYYTVNKLMDFLSFSDTVVEALYLMYPAYKKKQEDMDRLGFSLY